MVVSARSTASPTTAAPSVEELLAAIQASARTNPTLALIKIQALGNRKTISSQHGNSIHTALDEVFNANKTSNGLVVIKAVNNLAKNNPQLFTREQLQQWVGKSLAILNDRFSAQDKKSAALTLINDCWDAVTPSQVPVVIGKAIELIDATPEVSGAALTLINDRWNALKPKQQEDILTKSIALAKSSSYLVSSEALNLLTNRLPREHSEREKTAEKTLRILLESDNQFILTAAANFTTQHIMTLDQEPSTKVRALTRLAAAFSKSNEPVAAIFEAGLESFQVVAEVTFSKPSPVPLRPTDCYGRTWPARAAQPHQPAINLAFERPSR
jgi:hypothetical protein